MAATYEKTETGLICRVEDGGLVGYVVIDSTVRGRSCGGLRIAPDVSEDEIRILARSSTLKFGFPGLPQGGAKAGVCGDPDAPRAERLDRLVEFGRAIHDVLRDGSYMPSADMGTTNTDMRHMLSAVGVRVPRRALQECDSGYYTACSVLGGVITAAGHTGVDLAGATVAVEGFGKVGGALAGLLAEAGVKVVAVSTSRGALHNPQGLAVGKLTELARDAGSRVVEVYAGADRIERSALLALPVDILCPCARHHSLHAGNAGRVRARVICAGANNPLTREAEEALISRGVLCLPDFVTNCGGVLGGTMAFASIPHEKIRRFIVASIGSAVRALLAEASRSGLPLRAVAEAAALRRFESVKQRAEHPSLRGRMMSAGLSLYRHGLIPGRLVGALAPKYFESLPAFADAE